MEPDKIIDLNSALDKEDPVLFLKAFLNVFEDQTMLKYAQKKAKISDEVLQWDISLRSATNMIMFYKILKALGILMLYEKNEKGKMHLDLIDAAKNEKGKK